MATSSFNEILVIENKEESERMLKAFKNAESSSEQTNDEAPTPLDVKKIKEIYGN